jgi:predicted AAA+ superfamily ATPase
MNADYSRWAVEAVLHKLSVRRIVSVAGVRQSGKTTLLGQLSIPGMDVRTMDDEAQRRAAALDPNEFVKRESGGPLVIDEVQKVPDLLSAMKIRVDRDRTPGQYLITGSSNLQANPNVHESLAGRMGTVRLRTLAQGEILGLRPTFLPCAFERSFRKPVSGFDRPLLVELAFRGGYPEAMALPETERPRWHRDYLETLLRRDVRDLLEIRNLPALRRMATGLAGYSSKFLNKSEFAAACEASRPTVDTYVAALEALYLFDQVPPWTPGDYDRAIRSPKWYAADPGTMAALLHWDRKTILGDPDRLGKLVETFVYHELATQVDLVGDCTLYHYRDHDKREIDFLVEDGEGRMLGIEVKAGSAVRSDDFEHLDWFRERFRPDLVPIVLNTGTEPLSFGKGRYAVPIASLFGS